MNRRAYFTAQYQFPSPFTGMGNNPVVMTDPTGAAAGGGSATSWVDAAAADYMANQIDASYNSFDVDYNFLRYGTSGAPRYDEDYGTYRGGSYGNPTHYQTPNMDQYEYEQKVGVAIAINNLEISITNRMMLEMMGADEPEVISFTTGEEVVRYGGGGVEKGKDSYWLLAYLYYHYQFGKRKPITLSTSQLDLSYVRQSDLQYNPDKNIYSVNLFSLNPTNPTALALGNISLKKVGDNLFEINPDKFDFNYLEGGSVKRNIVTLLGSYYVFGQIYDKPVTSWAIYRNNTGLGGPFKIKFTGTVYIKP